MTTGPRVCNAWVSAAAVTSGRVGEQDRERLDHLRVCLFLHLLDRTRQRRGILDDA